MDDKELILIEQAKKGCQKAFEQLYNKYSKMVESTVRMYTKEPSIIDELKNTVFIKVFKKLNYFVTNDSFEKWVKTIAINTCIDYTRCKKREFKFISVDNDEFNIQLQSLYSSPDDNLIETETSSKFKEACKGLTKKQLSLIELYYIEGYLYREIAKKLALPIGTVKSELYRAKLKLKQLLTTSNN